MEKMENSTKETKEPIDSEQQVQDQEVEEVVEGLVRLRDRLMPYQRPIMIGGFIILIILVVFLGFAYGGMKVCSQLDGILDSGFKCHPNYYDNLTQTIEPYGGAIGMPQFNIPNNNGNS